MADQSQTPTGLPVFVCTWLIHNGGLHQVLTLPATVLFVKTNSVVFLYMKVYFLHHEAHSLSTQAQQ